MLRAGAHGHQHSLVCASTERDDTAARKGSVARHPAARLAGRKVDCFKVGPVHLQPCLHVAQRTLAACGPDVGVARRRGGEV